MLFCDKEIELSDSELADFNERQRVKGFLESGFERHFNTFWNPNHVISHSVNLCAFKVRPEEKCNRIKCLCDTSSVCVCNDYNSALGVFCTLENGHAGRHIACATTRHDMAAW